eukprot:8579862-Pyramimonas_sp.AAC.1
MRREVLRRAPHCSCASTSAGTSQATRPQRGATAACAPDSHTFQPHVYAPPRHRAAPSALQDQTPLSSP